MLKSLKKFIIRYIRTYGPIYLRHYLWPRPLHSRMFNWDIYYQNKNKIRVNFGAGPYFEKKGWLSVDFLNPSEINNSNIRKNYKHIDLTNVHNFNLGKIDIGYASHFCEHLNLSDLRKFLKNISMNIKKGGLVRIIVPDSDLILYRLKENDLEFFKPIAPVLKNLHDLEFDSVNIANVLLNQFSLIDNTLPKISLSDIMSYDSKSPSILNELNLVKSSKENKWLRKGVVEYGRLHMVALNYNILSKELKKAGFNRVIKSAFMQSMAPEMREVPIFDGTHPWLSLYVEAIK